ncbi:hypothetical protein F5Y13DRAFT_205733 [Hypoxylon sp. FL1857]|nr:hypothetical protein F5Y13DRAFT_205733 [Hypoxylon sp. FL1857]
MSPSQSSQLLGNKRRHEQRDDDEGLAVKDGHHEQRGDDLKHADKKRHHEQGDGDEGIAVEDGHHEQRGDDLRHADKGHHEQRDDDQGLGDKGLAYEPLRFVKQPPLSDGQSLCQSNRQCQSLSRTKDKPEVQFHQFAKLAPELRRKIWRETWQHRDVRLFRFYLGTRAAQSTAAIFDKSDDRDDFLDLHINHVEATRHFWGVHREGFDPAGQKEDLVTWTDSEAVEPTSLWVNRESRHETLGHFEKVLDLPTGSPWTSSRGGLSNCYFNFELDTLKFNLHSPLSAAFSLRDLTRLVRISIPETAPALPDFANSTGPFDQSVFLLKKKPNEDQETTQDFKLVWRYLRKYFPALREIRLESFHSCRRYRIVRISGQGPMTLPENPRRVRADIDNYCYACMNVQSAVDTTFSPIGVNLPLDYCAEHDLGRILDKYSIMEPEFKEETMVIGTVPGKNGGKGEDVTVTFRAIYDACDRSNMLDLKGRRVDWDQVKRECVARTLEHALGPPREDEFMVYSMQADSPALDD